MPNPREVSAPSIAKSPSGLLFAKVVNLPQGGNVALYQGKDEDGRPCVNILMNAYGVQSITQASGTKDSETVSKLLEVIDQDKCEEIYGNLRDVISKNAPQIVSVFEMNQVLAGFGVIPSMSKSVGKICQSNGQDFLAVRIEEKQENGQSRSSVFVLGHSTSKSFYYPDHHQRDKIYDSPERMTALIEEVATQQLGNEVVSKSTSRPRIP